MKICQVICSRGSGGLEKHFVDLCNGLSEHNQVIAIGHVSFAGQFVDAVTFEPLDLTRGRYNLLALLCLRRIIRKHKPDIVHAQANKAVAMVGKVIRGLPARFVGTLHNIKNNTRMFSRCDGVIAVSRYTAGLLDHSNVEVIYNGISSNAVVQDTYSLPDSVAKSTNEKMVVAIGRLVPAKGFDLLLAAWKGVNAHLLIAGDGPEFEWLADLVVKYDLVGRVHFLGHVKNIPALLQHADLVVIASRREGFSYVFCEALQSETCVISTDVPVANELLDRQFIVDAGDISGLHDLLCASLERLDEIREIQQPLYQFAKTELTLPKMVEKTELFYRELLRG